MTKITVAQYLVRELNKLGIEDFFGLPGDYNFNILDEIIKNPNTNWIGCTNELNAGYAADGYARLKGYGALVTTFGVGELSAVNAIAGSYAENVPVIKITGAPAVKFISQNTMLHHNFQNPDYRAFQRIYSNTTAASAFLTFENAKEEIDRIISVFKREQKPVYLAIPVDVCNHLINSEPNIIEPVSDEKALKNAFEHAKNVLNRAKKPVVLADVLINRFKAKNEFERFLEKTNYPFTTLVMGKSAADEENERFLGTYQGEYGNLKAYEMLAQSDAVVSIGTVLSDINTFRFSLPFSPDSFVNIQGTYTVVENVRYENVLMKDILYHLSENLTRDESVLPGAIQGYEPVEINEGALLTQDYFYSKFQDFLKPNDILFAETGIITYATAPLKLPAGVSLNNQVLWGSIGWATPASFGAQTAQKSRRTILLTGEGSLQLTCQEISSFVRHNQKPVIFVMNNSGYTIERLLSKDPDDEFNDIADWDYTKLPQVFKADAFCAKVRTQKELDEVLNKAAKEQKKRMCFVELVFDKSDVPSLTARVIKNKKC